MEFKDELNGFVEYYNIWCKKFINYIQINFWLVESNKLILFQEIIWITDKLCYDLNGKFSFAHNT